MRRSLLIAGLIGLLGAAGLTAQGAGGEAAGPAGRTIQVHPGQLQGALERAVDGDTLVVHRGRYRGSFLIVDRLRLVGAPGEARPLIDGNCGTNFTLAVRHSGVVLRHLAVVGADEGSGLFPSEVDFRDAATGRAEDLVVRDTCDAEYGINVFNSREVEIVGNRGRGFGDSAIYIGGISSTGPGFLRVARNEAFDNSRGIIVEDSAGGRVRLVDNYLHDNTVPSAEGPPAGIFLHNSDAVGLHGNRAIDNGRYGIQLDANSDRNRLFGNISRGNPAGNFHDEGNGNCGSDNHPDAFPLC